VLASGVMPHEAAHRAQERNSTMFVRESVTIGGRPLTFETGRLAKLADGAILVTYGESVVLVTTVSSEERPGLDFFPLTCEYVEKTYAAGKIPGGFFKREGRLRDYEILSSRLMDRPLRPLFPDGYKKDTQVIATVLSADKENPTDVLALSAASAALHVSDIPWDGPIAGVRVARVDGETVVFPTFDQSARADIDLVVAATKSAIVMVEGGADEASESDVIDALMFAHQEAQKVIELIEKLRAGVGRPKRAFVAPKLDEAVARRIAELADADYKTACVIKEKQARYDRYGEIKKAVFAKLVEELGAEAFAPVEKLAKAELEDRKATVVRAMVLDEGKRIDGRRHQDGAPDQLRGRHPAARSRLVAVSARRDPGHRDDDARYRERRAEDRRPHRRVVEAVHAPLQLPPVLHG
jgi:polyribonucleotide nucleotidyltransferase